MKEPQNTEFEQQGHKELLQSIFDGSPNTISVLKAIFSGNAIDDFEIVAVNSKVLEIAPGANPVGKRYSHFYPKAIGSGMLDVFREVMTSGETADFEKYYNGGIIDGWFRIIVVKVDGMIIVLSEDISNRKNAEKKFSDTLKLLELKNKIYAYAEDIAHMGTWTWDPQTNVAVYSDNMFVLFGLKPGEVEPTFETIPSFVHPDDRQRLLDGAAQIKEGGKPVGLEYRIIRKDGAERIFINRMRKEGNILFGITEDVTERKDTEKLELEVKQRTSELNESKELLQSVFDDSPNSIAVFENLQDENNKVIDFLPRMMNLVMINEVGRTDWIGKKYTQLFPHAKENGILKKMLIVANTGKSADFEQVHEEHGSKRWLRFMINKIGGLLMVTSEDITERKQTEQSVIDLKLRQQKEILNAIIATQEEERERIGENLHNGVAQLLYGIQTRLDLLNGSAADKAQIQSISTIVKQAIEDTRQISFELVPSVLKDYGIEVAVKSLYRRIANETLQVEFQFGKLLKRLPEKIEFAAYRIIQELLNNILKHSKATKALISIGIRKNNVYLDVYDNGVGFDETQLNPMDKGIGLQNIKNRVSLLDGTLTITSARGRTHFAIIIPLEGVGGVQ